MPYTPILATLGYVFSPDRSRVLLVHRNARPHDAHLGKYNGLGGKLESNEDVVTGMKREILEESGLLCEEMHLAGTISWPGFGRNGEDWFGFIFRIMSFSGALRESSPEGMLDWVKIEAIADLPMWEGDRHFLPLVLDPQSPQFHGVMPYRGGRPVSWSLSTLTRTKT